MDAQLNMWLTVDGSGLVKLWKENSKPVYSLWEEEKNWIGGEQLVSPARTDMREWVPYIVASANEIGLLPGPTGIALVALKKVNYNNQQKKKP